MIDIDELKDRIIANWYDGIDMEDLYQFYYDIQKQYLDEMDDEDVLSIAKSHMLIDSEEEEEA